MSKNVANSGIPSRDAAAYGACAPQLLCPVHWGVTTFRHIVETATAR
jgi:hypothetical protein